MEGGPEDAIAAEGCNQAHEQGSGSRAPGKSHPEIDSEGVANRNAVSGEAAALDAGHNPSRDQYLDEPLQLVEDGAHRIKERPLLGMEDLRKDPVRQESESHENADKNKQAPTGAQATGVEEESSHSVGSFRLRFFWFPVLKPCHRQADRTAAVLTGILIRRSIVGEPGVAVEKLLSGNFSS